MKPLDPKLLKHARATRSYIILTAVTGAVTAALIIAHCLLIANAIAPIIKGRAGLDHAITYLLPLAAVFVARFAVMYVQEAYAHRAAVKVIAQLRKSVLEQAVANGPRWISQGNGTSAVTLATRGLEDLEPYFVRYLPQLLLASTVTPAALVVVLTQDWIAAAIIAFTIPLIPIFMILIGRLTQNFADQKLKAMQKQGTQLLDLLAGLSTLKAMGREWGPAKRVSKLGEAYTKTTMDTLRVAFLSGAVLEFIATLSVALVAVSVGMRLVYDGTWLTTGLAVIMLAPEVYQPLREVGSQFHASANGVAAAGRAFEILENPAMHTTGTLPSPEMNTREIVFEDLGVEAPGRGTIAPSGLRAVIKPGEITVLVGRSGAGKSTAVAALLRAVEPTEGRIVIRGPEGETPLADIEPESWFKQITWIAQRPTILPATVLENTSPGSAVTEQLLRAAQATGFDRVVSSLPEGWQTRVGQGGVGLSVGQRQRLALTRALLSEQSIVVLDEPTAHLDAVSEATVIQTLKTLREGGKTILVIAHRPTLTRLADTVVEVSSREVVAA